MEISQRRISRIASPFVLGSASLFVALAATATRAEEQPLRFSVTEGAVHNEFYRQGTVAAHLVLKSGRSPRIIVAFPAGNSGTAVWFDAPTPITWQPTTTLRETSRARDRGEQLRGITAEITARGGPLKIRHAILSNVRVIRDYGYGGTTPAQILTAPQVSERSIRWDRRRLDGAAGYALDLELLTGTIRSDGADSIELVPGPNGELRLRITALTGDTPLTPLDATHLIRTPNPNVRLLNALAFLSYEEKLLAGSWRFNTYFGRDTLMSLLLMERIAQPDLVEAGLRAVIERLNAAGEVAHEEDIGEFALLRRQRAGSASSDEPILDYKMIDDDFMLAIVAAHCLLASGRSDRAGKFLATKNRAGDAYGALLARNLQYVVAATTKFANDSRWQHLIALKDGERVGNWRDSGDGLGGGRYPYDVNAVLAPAALDAIARLHSSGVLRPYLDANTNDELLRARLYASVWRQKAGALFDISIPANTARDQVSAYARQIGVDPARAMREIGADVRFRAIALDALGQPIPIVHSDEAFELLLIDASSEEVARVADTLTRSFPAGLLTDAGLVVANPAFAPAQFSALFDRARYHGTVIWSWQQALLVAGVERQLRRKDISSTARSALTRARDRVREVMKTTDATSNSELWSWSFANGRYRIEPFGQRDQDETESNAAQLWSTVHLGRSAPRP